jgi:hypothetical protein
MAEESPLLVVTLGNNDKAVPWEKLHGAALIRRRVRFGFGSADAQGKTEQIIIAK